jgi:hypothetical protein
MIKTISSSDYIASPGRMISEYQTGRTEGSRHETPQQQKPVSE